VTAVDDFSLVFTVTFFLEAGELAPDVDLFLLLLLFASCKVFCISCNTCILKLTSSRLSLIADSKLCKLVYD
jgi:hypothetical protein